MSVGSLETAASAGDVRSWNALPVAVLRLRIDGTALFCNRAWSTLTGHALEGLQPRAWARHLDEEQLDHLLHLFASGKPGDVELSLDTARGRRWTRWVWSQPAAGDSVRLVVVLDITVDHQRRQRLTEQATHDSLTGVTNRGSFLELVDEALQATATPAVALVFADLDGFKQVNDTGGHALGDQVLCLVAERLRQHLRSSDTLGRVGGDEFAVLCVGGASDVESVASRVTDAFIDPFTIDGQTMHVSASVGVAFAADDEADGEALLARADQAMYTARARATFRTG